MRFTVQQIFSKIASTVNQEATSPTAGSSEWTLWLEYLNRGVQEWSEAHDWETMRKVYYPVITDLNQSTVTLPADYKKLAGSPRLFLGTDTELGTEYPFIPYDTKNMYVSSSYYVTESGDLSNGFTLTWHPGTLSSGASITIPYYAMPTSLASPANIPVVNDSQFLIDRTIAYIFEARSDPRFQQMEVKARDRLMMMVENSNLAKFNSYENPNPVSNTLKRVGFRMGRD